MLSGLAEYIFGRASGSDGDAPSSAEGEETGQRSRASMQITYAEDDWVLVDVTSRCPEF